MTTIARTHEKSFANGHLDPEDFAVQKNQDYEKQRTYWIFKDKSAWWQDSFNYCGVVTNYGFHCDYEQLPGNK